MTTPGEPKRLEDLWAGSFGDEYSVRNAEAAQGRGVFWADVLARTEPRSVLEVGCNVGGNLNWIAGHVAGPVVGLDVNRGALGRMRDSVAGAAAVCAAARALPFADDAVDLAFTAGVLIHQPPDTLREVMSEIVRCAGRFVVCVEYAASEPTEVLYRGMERALWKRDFGSDYLAWFDELTLLDTGFLARGEGSWDDVTWWIMRKS